MNRQAAHWDETYRLRGEGDLSWFEAEPALSLELVLAHSAPEDRIIDVGAGAGRLVDGLLRRGRPIAAVLDLSETALQVSKDRLGAVGDEIDWIVADVTAWTPQETYALWHDRAVFHFLTDPAERAAYVAAMDRALAPGGVAIISTFAEDGPERCSGLPVIRYSPASLAEQLDVLAPGRFTRVEARRQTHRTPKGSDQKFQFSVFRKTAG